MTSILLDIFSLALGFIWLLIGLKAVEDKECWLAMWFGFLGGFLIMEEIVGFIWVLEKL